MHDIENMNKTQLREELKKLQAKDDENTCKEYSSHIKHELEVHKIKLEMQNRELRESKRQLEEACDNYANLYDFSPVSYVTFNDKGTIENINLTGADIMDDVRANIIGNSFLRWLDFDNRKIFQKHLQKTFSSENKVENEITLKLKNGKYLDVKIESIRSKDLLTNTDHCRSIILDITESNIAKNEIFLQARQLKLITDALPLLIAYIDYTKNHLFANKTYIETFGVVPADIIGKTAQEVWGPYSYKRVKKYLRHALSGQHVKFEMELPVGSSNKKHLSTTLIPDTDNISQIYGVIVLIGDVTDKLAIEAIERKRLLDIAHFSRLSSMGEMASQIAHELNQPLTAISTYSDACRRMVLSDKDVKNKLADTLEDISTQAERAGAIIHRIREFVSNKDLHRTNINLNDLVKEALQLLSVEIRSHMAELKLDLDEKIPDVFADKVLIEQVIVNLTRNALEAMEEIDSSNRLLTISTTLDKSKYVVVSIKDSGPGLPKEKRDRIFDPFHTTKENGMGMGLSISYSIIDTHNGRVWVNAGSQGGAIFSFTLPTKNVEDDNAT